MKTERSKQKPSTGLRRSPPPRGRFWAVFGGSQDFQTAKSSGLRDYRKPYLTGKRLGEILLKSLAVTVLLAVFFYRSPIAVILLLPVGALYFSRELKGLVRKDRRHLEEEFKECIEAVRTSLKAGYSAENAFLSGMEEMEQMYGADSLMLRELELIKRGLVVNIPLEELLASLGERSGSEPIAQFAEVFAIAKKRGGNGEEAGI